MKKSVLESNQITLEINSSVNRVNKGYVTELKDGSKWIEFNSFSLDCSHKIYNLDEYEDYLLNIYKNISEVTSLTLPEFHKMIAKIGIIKSYCVQKKI